MEGSGEQGAREHVLRRVVIKLTFLIILALTVLAATSGNAQASEQATRSNEIELVYFYPRFRCLSCEQVDAFAAEAASSYSDESRTGIPYSRLSIDDPANSERVQTYGVVGSSLYLVTTNENGEDFQELKNVWFLWEDKAACVAYIHEQVALAFEGNRTATANPGYPWAGIPLLAAFGLGLLTAISPCPLATNIAAIAFVAKRMDSRKDTLLSGALYTAGRAFSYIALGVGLVYLGANVVGVSKFLRNSGEFVLGPLLIIVSLFMLDVMKIRIFRGGLTARLQERFATKGMAGSFSLGAIFALAFCPYSAVLFFGMLLPLALETGGGGVFLPAAYAVGTGLPVFVFAVFLSLGAARLGKRVNNLQRFELYLRKVVGFVFLGVGAYYVFQLVKAHL